MSKHIPSFADTQVWVAGTGGKNGDLKVEAPNRPVTVQDLLRHTSGIVYGEWGETPVHALYRESTIKDLGKDRDLVFTQLQQTIVEDTPMAVAAE